jgi:hypothetical protein
MHYFKEYMGGIDVGVSLPLHPCGIEKTVLEWTVFSRSR